MYNLSKNLLSIFNGTNLPSSEGSHILVNEISTCSSFSTITLKLVPLILHHWENNETRELVEKTDNKDMIESFLYNFKNFKTLND